MFAQLIVIDFSKGKRQVDFEKLAGHPRYIIAYCREQLFEEYIAHLYNYERLDNRALCEIAFLFESQVNPTPDTPLESKLSEMVKNINSLYIETAKVDLIAVMHHSRTTICSYIPTDGLADIGESLDWLHASLKKEKVDEQPVGGKDESGAPQAPSVRDE